MYEVMSEKTRQQLREEGRDHYLRHREDVANVSIVSNHFWRDMKDDEAKANARLIAAAPDLLDALQEAISMLGSRLIKDTFGYEWHEKATSAIAKATGETNA